MVLILKEERTHRSRAEGGCLLKGYCFFLGVVPFPCGIYFHSSSARWVKSLHKVEGVLSPFRKETKKKKDHKSVQNIIRSVNPKRKPKVLDVGWAKSIITPEVVLLKSWRNLTNQTHPPRVCAAKMLPQLQAPLIETSQQLLTVRHICSPLFCRHDDLRR